MVWGDVGSLDSVYILSLPRSYFLFMKQRYNLQICNAQ